MGLTSSPVDWYAARASGIVAYVLLTLVVLVGLTLSGKVRFERWPRFAVEDVHRFGGLLVGVFVWVHVLTIATDTFTPFSLADLVVPFSSDFRPLWTALGVVAAELLLALAITNALRARLPHRFWRRAHMLNFVVFVATTGHGLFGGSDGSAIWSLYVVSAASVVAAAALRSSSTRPNMTASTQSPSRR